jgi:hypothetical protein
MSLMKRNKDGSLVRKILIERSDAYAGDFSDAIGGYGVRSLSLEDADDGFKNGVNGLPRAKLLRLPAMEWRCESSLHLGQIMTNVSFCTVY